MELLDKLKWRYAAKAMNGEKVSEDKITRILEAARLAATSSGNPDQNRSTSPANQPCDVRQICVAVSVVGRNKQTPHNARSAFGSENQLILTGSQI